MKKNSLGEKFPQLVREWHPTKNDPFTPNDFTYGSNKKVWWMCKEQHEWQAIINNRVKGNGCPYCGGKLPTKENCLASLNPSLSSEWNQERNGSMTPYDVLPKSHKKVWWFCKKGHEWEEKVSVRSKKIGCPYCAGKRATTESCLATLFPNINEEWHNVLNKNITPFDVTPGSHKKVWWICKEGHEWQTSVSQRTRKNKGSGCPYCSGKIAHSGNSLGSLKPELIKQWHPSKNGSLSPFDVTASSDRKVWWKCEKGHEWRGSIGNRRKEDYCPVCWNKVVSFENSFAATNPECASEWHPTKNGNLTPKDVVEGSSKRVWWKCNMGHEWQTTVYKRKETGCPYCSGSLATEENNLGKLFPYLIKEWHTEKNNCTPFDVAPKAKKKFWWKCENRHEWQAAVYSRTGSQKTGCPECSSHIKTSFPEQSLFYYLKRVISDTQNRYFFNTGQRVLEIDIYIPSLKIGIEYDGYYYHRTKKAINKDERKNNELLKGEIRLIRIREPNLPLIKNCEIIKRTHETSLASLDKVITDTLNLIGLPLPDKGIDTERDYPFILGQMVSNIEDQSLKSKSLELSKEWHPSKNGILTPSNVYANSSAVVWWQCEKNHEWQARVNARQKSGCPYCSGRKATSETSLAAKRPDLIREWHLTKNNDITIHDVTPNSNKLVWWRCDHGHEWQSTVHKRSKAKTTACPACKTLSFSHPELTKEWHPNKNEGISPNDVSRGSKYKAWWLCIHGHEWQASISNRVKGTGCPYCKNKKATVRADNHIKKTHPDVAKWWDYDKNNTIKPSEVTFGSGKKVWWQCKKGHSFNMSIANKVKRNSCPYCSNQKLSDDNRLYVRNPLAVRLWHPTKNGRLSPKDVSVHSQKKVWWQCEKGHEWETSVSHISRGQGCPYCSNRRVTSENCLASRNPQLSLEWHPSENGNLTPKMVMPGSGKKVWWQCKKGHEWRATIDNRNRGRGCPYCSGKVN